LVDTKHVAVRIELWTFNLQANVTNLYITEVISPGALSRPGTFVSPGAFSLHTKLQVLPDTNQDAVRIELWTFSFQVNVSNLYATEVSTPGALRVVFINLSIGTSVLTVIPVFTVVRPLIHVNLGLN